MQTTDSGNLPNQMKDISKILISQYVKYGGNAYGRDKHLTLTTQKNCDKVDRDENKIQYNYGRKIRVIITELILDYLRYCHIKQKCQNGPKIGDQRHGFLLTLRTTTSHCVSTPRINNIVRFKVRQIAAKDARTPLDK